MLQENGRDLHYRISVTVLVASVSYCFPQGMCLSLEIVFH
jgi:hypothetical protein